ncbi:MAG: hypothetical protein WCV90_08075 [Candidatus Woesearchaeota archaeon]|jgi:hypothetical protein
MAHIEILVNTDPIALRNQANMVLAQGNYTYVQYQVDQGNYSCLLFAAGGQVSPRAAPEEHLAPKQIALSDKYTALALIQRYDRKTAREELALSEQGLAALLGETKPPRKSRKPK